MIEYTRFNMYMHFCIGMNVGELENMVFSNQLQSNLISTSGNRDQDLRIQELEQENQFLKDQLREIRLAASASQIRPHFLYNTLGAIQELCHEDPEKAECAIESLAELLKDCMQVWSADKLVPFAQELDHTKRYLEIESLRFCDQLSVVYDIAEDEFFLPPLTLQPIVENAVRYAVRGNEDGGTIWIRTGQKDGFYEVIVEDNGPGFDMNWMERDNGSGFCAKRSECGDGMQLGIKNVRERLQNLVDGELLIDSDGGKGTRVTIRIRKN